MFKKIMAITLLLLSLLLYRKSSEFLNFDNLMMTVNGKSSGQFKPYKSFACYDGVYANFNSDYNYKKFIENLKCKFVKKEEVDGVVCLYYYTEKLPKKEIIDGKKVNLHIAVSNEKIVIGTPVIYAGF